MEVSSPFGGFADFHLIKTMKLLSAIIIKKPIKTMKLLSAIIIKKPITAKWAAFGLGHFEAGTYSTPHQTQFFFEGQLDPDTALNLIKDFPDDIEAVYKDESDFEWVSRPI